MESLKTLTEWAKIVWRIIAGAQKLQESTRKEFVQRLQEICKRCDASYSNLLPHLARIKAAYHNPQDLQVALVTFVNDADLLAKFSPLGLCQDAQNLLMDLSSNLSPLKYSVAVGMINTLIDRMNEFYNFDSQIYQQFCKFRSKLDDIAQRLNNSGLVKSDIDGLVADCRLLVDTFEDDLFDMLNAIRDVERRALPG